MSDELTISAVPASTTVTLGCDCYVHRFGSIAAGRRAGCYPSEGLSIERCSEGGWGYWRAAESRPSKVMSKAFRAVFQRMVQRA